MIKKILFCIFFAFIVVQLSAQIDSAKLSKNFTPQQIEEFKVETSKKIKDLERYIRTIGNSKNPEERTDAFRQALNLFYKPDISIVEVTNKSGIVTSRNTSRNYMLRILGLRYDKVVFEYFNVNFQGEPKRQPDGTYQLTVHLCQKFAGYRDNKLVYEDVVCKKVQTIYKQNEITDPDGKIHKFWIVRIGDIKVNHPNEN
jgi:hypothetical protein